MATPVGPNIDIVLQRAFDPEGTGTTRAQVLDLFSRTQQVVNGAFDTTLATQAMATGPNLQVYNFERIAVANDVLRIRSVRDGTRDLSRVPFEKLKAIDNHWFGRSGRRFETYAVLGRKILIVSPMRQAASTVNVVYTQQLPVFTRESDNINLPDDQIQLLNRMVEALVLLKQRDLDKLAPLMQELTTTLGSMKQTERVAA